MIDIMSGWSHVVLFHVLISHFKLLHRKLFTLRKLGGKLTSTFGGVSPRSSASIIIF
jgi:hypothetical protein